MSKSVETRINAQLATRNSKVLASFVAYCQQYPDQRFWQALRNWSDYNFVLVSNTLPPTTEDMRGCYTKPYEIYDTFYWEGRST